MTMMSPRQAIAPASVKLKHGTRDIELGAAHSVLTLGRDQQNDVMIADRKASRLHARIERRRDKFVLIDHSSNGTYVTVEGEPELALRREELVLRGRRPASVSATPIRTTRPRCFRFHALISMGQLDGKVAIVTGAAGGFGEGIARLFAAEGARVLLADLDLAKASSVATEIGPRARAQQCDVANGASVHAAVKACVDAFGPPDIVVNNAGTTHRSQPMLDVDEATFDKVFAVNVKSIYYDGAGGDSADAPAQGKA